MAPTILIYHAICFIIVQVIFVNVARGDVLTHDNNVTNDAAPLELGRLKRSLFDKMPLILQIRVKYGSEEEINLKWIRRDRHLANEHLPVDTAFVGVPLNFMSEIGEFVVYHDVDKLSAVVYFEKSNVLYGVIGTNYYIEALPYNFDENGEYESTVVGEPYIQRHGHLFVHIHPDSVYPPPFDTDAWVDFIGQSHDGSDQSLKRKSNCDAGPSTKRQRTGQDSDTRKYTNAISRTYYLETLVFVTRDIAELLYYIIYFNAVDMIFGKLSTMHGELHINIAEIVVENQFSLPFNFINNNNLQFNEVVTMLPQFLHTHQNRFRPDSFDYVFIHTSHIIMDGTVSINGLTRHNEDLYEARKNNQFYEVVPITMATYHDGYADYLIAVHEIGRILNMKIDSKSEGLNPTGQCCGIMQRGGPKCGDCLKWSPKSEEQFDTFFRSNRNRCFLLNEPRSLRLPGPSRFLTPHLQCKCYGYDSYKTNRVGDPIGSLNINECTRPLQCQRNYGQHSHVESTVLPFDGTRCAHTKVCWNGECIIGSYGQP